MRYLFIESRSERESPDVAAMLELAGQLRGAGHDVTVFLIQNAVATAGCASTLTQLMRLGVDVQVDGVSLADRGLGAPRPAPARRGDMSDLVGLLMTPGVVAAWH